MRDSARGRKDKPKTSGASAAGTRRVTSTRGCGRGPCLPRPLRARLACLRLACLRVACFRSFLTFFPHSFCGEAILRAPRPRWQCSHPEPGGLVFPVGPETSAEGGVLTPEAQEEKFQNVPHQHSGMQARVGLPRKSASGCQAPSFQWGVCLPTTQPRPVSPCVQALGDLSVLCHCANSPKEKGI